ncbi:calcium-activated SK potassium channel domain-containing protein [Ditylenchus destructor]|uniref:Calcium-activated SK potassium channel domain-containing protein n=1 Tax=Ditylenchus destructor TaxID=166010 RepID=A0AAD4N4B9_9BILA|nr:calcium-activated SK potassium channel domain-containing protein [Ditylenchus destructor]
MPVIVLFSNRVAHIIMSVFETLRKSCGDDIRQTMKKTEHSKRSITYISSGGGTVTGIPAQQHLGSGMNSPARHHRPAIVHVHGQNFSVDSAAYQQIIDRRKSFRTRGSLGPTVASAPSVEQEDYRTPKPSVCSIGKTGKSFDLGGATEPSASDSHNGLIKVSADFLRLNGSRQQFRSLLSRKKLGQMPPAYTQIDYSHDSVESNQPGIRGTNTHPAITVEDAGDTGTPGHKLSLTSSAALVDSQKSSLDTKSINENGGLQSVTFTTVGLCPPGAFLTAASGGGGAAHQPAFKRNNSRYGVPIDDSAVKMVYKIRSQRLNTRVRITDRCLITAMIGIILMVIDTEMSSQHIWGITKDHPISLLLRTFVVLSTVTLLIEIIHYHINEILLELVDCGADDFRVVLRTRRVVQFMAEFILCSLCPLPFTGTVEWSFIEASRFNFYNINPKGPYSEGYVVREVPVDVLLSLLMLSRVYLVGRFMVLHSKQFQDASTRTLAALNRIQVNFAFVMKTALDQQPILFLSLFLLIFWLITSWTFAQCERFGRLNEEPSILYTNALWFIAITFNGNGYGDIVPKTLAGKCIAVLVGISGAVISSILIAVISRKILLSQGQRNVNNFMNDSRLIQEHKHAAARVLQKTWHIYRCLQTNDTPDHLLRTHQRKFLDAIHQFRKIKNKIRVFNEDSSTSFQQMNRLMTEMHTSMQRLVCAQEEMRAQIEVLQRAMRNHFTHANATQVGRIEASPPTQHPSRVAFDPIIYDRQ